MTKPVYFNNCGCGVALSLKRGNRLVTTGVQSCVVLLVISRFHFFAIHLFEDATRDINNFTEFCTEVRDKFERHSARGVTCVLCYSNHPESLRHAQSISNTISEELADPVLHQLDGAQGADVEFIVNIDRGVEVIPYNDQGGQIYAVPGELHIDEIREIRENAVYEGLKRNGFYDGFAVGIDEFAEEESSDSEREDEEEYFSDFNDSGYMSENELVNKYKVKNSKVKKKNW